MNETRERRRESLLQFLHTIQKAGLPIESLSDTDRLVASGLIDSLAILQIVAYLETAYDIDFSMRGVSAEELGSIGSILDVIEQDQK